MYKEAIEAAGAEVLAFETFGSYQGDWLAKIKIDGKVKYIHDYYGSCSHCDAFESDFGFVSHSCGNDDYYDPFWEDDGFRDNCSECQNLKKRFVEFGQNYVDNAVSFEECMKIASENLEWDMDAQDLVDWLNNNK